MDGHQLETSPGFSVDFRPAAPVWIDNSLVPIKLEPPELDVPDVPDEVSTPGDPEDLKRAVLELESLRQTLAELEEMVAEKEQYLLQTFGYTGVQEGECDTYRCRFSSFFTKVKETAVAIFDGLTAHAQHRHHPKRPGCGKHGHGNHTHRNHTHHRPHFRLPPHFCHPPPPKPPGDKPERPDRPEHPPWHENDRPMRDGHDGVSRHGSGASVS
jgi:hypothetical protein